MNARRLGSRLLFLLVINVAILTAIAPWSHATPVSPPLVDAGANTGGLALPITINGATGNIGELFALPFDSISGAFYSPNGSQLIGSGADVSR